MYRTKRTLFIVWLVFFVCIISPIFAYSAHFKVLVVMSYEEDFPWCKEVKEGIESVLADYSVISYFYMNTKSDLAGGTKKSVEAYEIYKKIQPDGVIAVDDNAQSMFVVPYLKDKVKTPVMFCGVNDLPEKYGYPSSNVSGILERPHFSESFAFAQQLIPSIKTVGFIIKDSPTGEAHFNQTQREADTYPVKIPFFKMPKTVYEIIAMTKEIKDNCDAIIIASLAGIVDESEKPLTEKEGIKIALKTFGNKPVIGAESYTVEYGALCTVARTGQEQGETSARMLLDAMKGRPVAEISITQNQKGRRIINATVLKTLGIKPRPEILRGAELVRTED